VPHCIKGEKGHDIIPELDISDSIVFEKHSFGSIELAQIISSMDNISEVELCGLCTDICIVSTALILKAALPETLITVDAKACAGVTPDTHSAALITMKMCQINIQNA